jgi:hypothetical protein
MSYPSVSSSSASALSDYNMLNTWAQSQAQHTTPQPQESFTEVLAKISNNTTGGTPTSADSKKAAHAVTPTSAQSTHTESLMNGNHHAKTARNAKGHKRSPAPPTNGVDAASSQPPSAKTARVVDAKKRTSRSTTPKINNVASKQQQLELQQQAQTMALLTAFTGQTGNSNNSEMNAQLLEASMQAYNLLSNQMLMAQMAASLAEHSTAGGVGSGQTGDGRVSKSTAVKSRASPATALRATTNKTQASRGRPATISSDNANFASHQTSQTQSPCNSQTSGKDSVDDTINAVVKLASTPTPTSHANGGGGRANSNRSASVHISANCVGDTPLDLSSQTKTSKSKIYFKFPITAISSRITAIVNR